MKLDKTLVAGSVGMLILRLLSDRDMYGYEITAELKRLSDDTFALKAGTLYPLLHSLEEKAYVSSYDSAAENGKTRRYYSLTKNGSAALKEKITEWRSCAEAVEKVLKGGAL